MEFKYVLLSLPRSHPVRLIIKVSTTKDGKSWAYLTIEETLDPESQDPAPSWSYISNLVGDSRGRALAALFPTQKGLATALEDYADSIYPKA